MLWFNVLFYNYYFFLVVIVPELNVPIIRFNRFYVLESPCAIIGSVMTS